ELLRAEVAAFWERWGPEAYRIEAILPNLKEVPKESDLQAKWVIDRWWMSVQSVVKDFVLDTLKAWGEEASKASAAAAAAARRRLSATGAEQEPLPPGDRDAENVGNLPIPSGLVIRIFGRFTPRAAEWVNIANLPLAGDWREQALRLLLPSAKDVQDVPFMGPLAEAALTAVVTGQVYRVVTTSVWGSLTTDLWKSPGGGEEEPKKYQGLKSQPFQIGYEVVEVPTQVSEDMCALARDMPISGSPGRVIRIRPGTESMVAELKSEQVWL
ncbi:unnamed protein product, partial [Polarella glacialis]